MPKNCSSLVWDYFEITDNNKSKCKLCDVKLSREGGGSTNSMRKHLEAKHKDEYNIFMLKKKESAEEEKGEMKNRFMHCLHIIVS
jgi:hypothetical protein